MVVNEVFVEWFFPGRNPVGRTLTMTLDVPDGEFTFDPKAIVGIVGNAVHESIREPIRPIVYLPIAQEPLQSLFVAGAFIAVRSEAASPERLSRSLAAALVERRSRCAGVVPHRHGHRGLRARAGSPGGPPGDFGGLLACCSRLSDRVG